MKIIAFHLPQYHSIPENDRWWGEGFTEWTNVKKAEPLFKDHNQPRVPHHEYYYNMLDPKARRWQADLAKQYGIYGFCYYHYWFNGKLLLEKPLEAIIEDSGYDLSFCVCWANEPWTRSWDGKTNEILMAQEYGSEKDWREHFDYLLNLNSASC
jgi:lipopolysaccharide biosynthesis protein